MEQLLRTSIPSLKLVNRQRLPVTACARYQLAFLMLRRRRARVYVRWHPLMRPDTPYAESALSSRNIYQRRTAEATWRRRRLFEIEQCLPAVLSSHLGVWLQPMIQDTSTI